MAIKRAIHHTYPERLKNENKTNASYNSGFTMEYDHAKHDLVYRKKKINLSAFESIIFEHNDDKDF